MILPKEILRKIFSFFENKKYKCDLCNISNDYVGIYSLINISLVLALFK